jgi:ketosteroid isomerase-like protein
MTACSPSEEADKAAVTTVLESFYGAMKTGTPEAAMALIAPDAVFLESGRLETRQQYEESHLPADIEFEAQVTGQRSPLNITINGDTAWVIATTEYDGEFDGSPVAFTSVQLMVLSRVDGDWKIRTMHWSSQRR